MDFGWTEEQQRRRQEVIDFARRELNDDVRERDAGAAFSAEAWKRCAGFGIQGLPVPEEYGGQGADPITIMMTMEALGYGCADNGLLFGLGAQMWSAETPLVRFGTEEQKRRFLPGLCDGSLVGVQAMTEPESGSDAFAMSTLVEQRGDRYVLDGTKTFITNAPVADVIVVFATSAPGRGFGGASAFLVERGTPGLEIGPPLAKMGLRTIPMGEVRLSGCEVPAENRLGPAGAGLAIFNHSMDWERSYILAGAVGTMQRQLDRCISRARERRQFGQAIGKFQAVAHRIVDIHTRVRTGRLLLYELAWLRTQKKSTTVESALAKLWVSESFLASSLDALFVHGGAGYLTENELERDVRDAVAGCIYSGTSDMQRNIIAARLGL
ncbi:MAG TPA: acyl-CoA dehydrogenase family protein [Acidimicrobiales bacterium]|nr:acyl-CoA dehydrogenase family protein [Acidimicrobiales bacterium]